VKSVKNKIVFILLIVSLIVAIVALTPQRAQSDDKELIDENIQATVLDDHARNLVKTIALIETSGTLDCSIPGLSGEKGCHQYMPTTWKSYSEEVFGVVKEQTEENAETVTLSMIRKWLDDGRSDEEIFLIWNSGSTRECRSGINSHGVRYDSCTYVKNAIKILNELSTSK
jgi:hypothetical protein